MEDERMVRIISVGSLSNSFDDLDGPGVGYSAEMLKEERRREREIARANQLPTLAALRDAGKKPKSQSQPVTFIAPPAERVDIGDTVEEIDQW